MTFQSTVAADQGFGIPGEKAFEGPTRGQPCQIDINATAANCVVGRMFSMNVATGLATPGSGGAAIVPGTNKLLGILVNPKNYPFSGTTAGGSLAPTLQVIPGGVYEFVEMTAGHFVTVANATKPGDVAEYNLTTGLLQSVLAGAAADAGFGLIPNASFDRVLLTAAGVSVLKMNGLV